MNDFEKRQLVALVERLLEDVAERTAVRVIQSNAQAIEAMPPKLLLSAKDVQRLTGLGHTKVEQLVASGDLPSFKLDGKRFVRAEDLQGFISRRFYEQNRDLAIQAEAPLPVRRSAS